MGFIISLLSLPGVMALGEIYVPISLWSEINQTPIIKAVFSSTTRASTHKIPGWISLPASHRNAQILSGYIHNKRKTCGGFFNQTSPFFIRSVQPVLFLKEQSKEQSEVTRHLSLIQPVRMIRDVAEFSDFHDRYYKSVHGIAFTDHFAKRVKAIIGERSDIAIKTITHENSPQNSLIIRWQGTKMPDEIVVLGAHLDSINTQTIGNPAPGADDNASGLAILLETIRLLTESGYQPERTLEFHAYAGEEEGLRGSNDIAMQYRNAGKKVVGMLNVDMALFSSAPSPVITLVKDWTHPEHNKILEELVDLYLKIPWIYDECGFPCSDHASWNKSGYPSSFIFEAPFRFKNPFTHFEKDSLEFMHNPEEHILLFAKLALAYTMEMTGPWKRDHIEAKPPAMMVKNFSGFNLVCKASGMQINDTAYEIALAH